MQFHSFLMSSKPVCSFLIFCEERRHLHKSPYRSNSEVTSILGAEWRSLDQETKDKYSKQAILRKEVRILTFKYSTSVLTPPSCTKKHTRTQESAKSNPKTNTKSLSRQRKTKLLSHPTNSLLPPITFLSQTTVFIFSQNPGFLLLLPTNDALVAIHLYNVLFIIYAINYVATERTRGKRERGGNRKRLKANLMFNFSVARICNLIIQEAIATMQQSI